MIFFWFYVPHNVTTVIHRKVSGEHISSHAHMLVKEKERERLKLPQVAKKSKEEYQEEVKSRGARAAKSKAEKNAMAERARKLPKNEVIPYQPTTHAPPTVHWRTLCIPGIVLALSDAPQGCSRPLQNLPPVK